MPPLPGSRPLDGEAPSGPRREFRLRSQGCLFTYNSVNIAVDRWHGFLTWLGTLEFLLRWIATMERSLRSAQSDRVHLHVFMEFAKSVDWTSLQRVMFMGIKPDAAPCTARGPRLRQALDHGHFYVYANKIGTLEVATSGYVPWQDYPVTGWWLDNLWTERKLDHDVYLEYAPRG